MIKELIKLANELDQRGLTEEAGRLDEILRKIAARSYRYHISPASLKQRLNVMLSAEPFGHEVIFDSTGIYVTLPRRKPLMGPDESMDKLKLKVEIIGKVLRNDFKSEYSVQYKETPETVSAIIVPDKVISSHKNQQGVQLSTGTPQPGGFPTRTRRMRVRGPLKAGLISAINSDYQSLEDPYSTAREPEPPGEDPGPDEQDLIDHENTETVGRYLVMRWEKLLFAALEGAEPHVAKAAKGMTNDDMLYALMYALVEGQGWEEVEKGLAIAKGNYLK